MNFLRTKILDDSSLLEIKKLISCCSESQWETGLKTFKGVSQTKNNLELSNPYITGKIFDITQECLKKSVEFNEYAFPKDVDNILITKTVKGGYYHPHTDIGFNGHLSTTIFLNDPEDYSGGELCFYVDGDEKKIKLKSGYSITYPTGIPHRVNEVTSGERLALVFWTRSLFKDPIMREICSELSSIKFGSDEEQFVQPFPDFEKVVSQNSFKLTNVINKLIRTYGDI